MTIHKQMNQTLLTRLPAELARLIYQMYFPWIMEELLEHQSQKNDFIVRATRSNKSVTEVTVHFGVLYLFETQTSILYRKGIPALPLELEQAYFSEQEDSSFPLGGGYVSPYVRDIVGRRSRRARSRSRSRSRSRRSRSRARRV